MNDISDTLGLLRREVKDARAISSNIDIKFTRLLEGDNRSRRDGSLVARFATCKLLAALDRRQAVDVARQEFSGDRDLSRLIELRSATGPAMTTVATWAAELIGITVADIAQNLLPASAFSQLRSLGMQYTFAGGPPVRVPYHQPSASGAFVPEGGAIPLATMLLASLTLKPKKAASIVALTRELLMSGPASVETSLKALIADDLGLTIDGILLGNSAATATAPGGILNGITPITPTPNTGNPIGSLLGDLRSLMTAIAPAARPVLLMNATQAAIFGVLVPPLPYLPLIVAPYLAANTIVAVDAAAFASALGLPDFNVSESPAVHMDSAPLPLASGPQGAAVLAAPTTSMWQQALTGFRSLVECDWQLRRPNAVAFISGVTW